MKICLYLNFRNLWNVKFEAKYPSSLSRFQFLQNEKSQTDPKKKQMSNLCSSRLQVSPPYFLPGRAGPYVSLVIFFLFPYSLSASLPATLHYVPSLASAAAQRQRPGMGATRGHVQQWTGAGGMLRTGMCAGRWPAARWIGAWMDRLVDSSHACDRLRQRTGADAAQKRAGGARMWQGRGENEEGWLT